jgi:hypothetical protein
MFFYTTLSLSHVISTKDYPSQLLLNQSGCLYDIGKERDPAGKRQSLH